MPWVGTARLHPNTLSMVEQVSRAFGVVPNLNLKFLGNERLCSVQVAKNFGGEEPEMGQVFSVNK